MSLCTYMKVNGHRCIFLFVLIFFFFRSRLWTSIYNVGLDNPKHDFPEVVVKGPAILTTSQKEKTFLWTFHRQKDYSRCE